MKKLISVVVAIIIVMCFITPKYCLADDESNIDYNDSDIRDYLLSPLASLIAIIGDSINNIIYVSLANEDANVVSALLPIGVDRTYVEGNENIGKFLDEHGEALPEGSDFSNVIIYTGDLSGDYGVPNIRISPAEIFANKVALLNANYFDMDQTDEIGGEAKSIIFQIREVVSNWYNKLRMIAIVGMLSVLIYIGIRIMLSATGEDKAKYKTMIMDWIVGLCLIFCLHYIMAFTMAFVDKVVGSINSDESVSNSGKPGIEKQLHIEVRRGTEDNPYISDDEEVNELVTSEMNLTLIKNLARTRNEEFEGYTFENYQGTFETMYEVAPKLFKVNGKAAFDDIPEIEVNINNPNIVYEDNRETTIKVIFWYIEKCKNNVNQGILLYKAALYASLTPEQKHQLYEQWSTDYTGNSADAGEMFRNLYDSVKDLKITTKKEELKGDLDKKDGKEVQFYSNLAGYMRMQIEYKNQVQKLTASVMYLALTFYTVYFIFIYLKRLLLLTFYTMIAPLVALTYPIDKIKDSKAQAFNFWLKEYTSNAILPVIHSVLYKVLVSSAGDLVAQQPLYAICALAFIVPAEKLIKNMFGKESQTAPKLGGFAAGAMTANAMKKLSNKIGSGNNKKNGNSGNSGKIRTKPTGINADTSDYIVGNSNNKNNTANRKDSNGSNSNRENTNGNTGNKSQNGINSNVNSGSQNGNINNKLGNSKNPKTKKGILKNAANMARKKLKLPKGKKEAAKVIAARLAKGSIKLGTGLAFAGVGLAAGIVGGDMSDMAKGLAGGMAAGKIAGDKLAEKAGRAPGKVADVGRELFKGEDAAALASSNKEFIKNEENREYMEKYHPELKGKDRKEYMKKMNMYKISSGEENIERMDQLVKFQKQDEAAGIEEDLAVKKNIELSKYSQALENKVYTNDEADEYKESFKNQLMSNNASIGESVAQNSANEIWNRSQILNNL